MATGIAYFAIFVSIACAALYGPVALLPAIPLVPLALALQLKQMENSRRSQSGLLELRDHQNAFAIFFTLIAKLAKSDGSVHEREIDVVERLMQRELRLGPLSRRKAIRLFRAGKNSPVPFALVARQFRVAVGDDSIVLLSALELLVRVAAADGHVSAQEDHCLMIAAEEFHIDAQVIRAMKVFLANVNGEQPPKQKQPFSRFYGRHQRQSTRTRRRTSSSQRTHAKSGFGYSKSDNLARSYEVLHCSPSADEQEIRSAYRRLVKNHHPDVLSSRRLPKELERRAAERFKEIQAAYEAIRRARSMH